MTDYEPPPLRQTLIATGVALIVALVVLFVAILPAEYDVDPTGIGGLLGLTGVGTTSDNATDVEPPTASNITETFTYRARWSATEITPRQEEGYTGEDDATSQTINITETGLADLTFTLRWSDDNETAGQSTGPDTFRIQVTGPDGTAYPAVLGRNDPGQPGMAMVSVPLTPPPQPLLVEAQTADEAAARAATIHPPSGLGTGVWEITVECVEAEDAEGSTPLPGPGASLSDQGNDWTLDVTGSRTVLDRDALEKVDVRREVIEIDIPAGGSVEYKFHIEEGDRFEYEWAEAQGLLIFYDFHGDPDSGTNSSSHRIGTDNADLGVFQPPFAGKHGWYFENRNDEVATVTLNVRGVFETVGFV